MFSQSSAARWASWNDGAHQTMFHRVCAAGVGEQLSQMGVVGPLKLVLHDDDLTGG